MMEILLSKMRGHTFYSFILVCTLSVFFATFTFIDLGAPLTGVDDANIFFVYARNLAGGQGFVYNADGERVEGFSSLLWTLIVSLTFLLTENPERLIICINIGLMIFSLAVLVELINGSGIRDVRCRVFRRTFPSYHSILLLAWIFCSPGYVCWNVLSLMDTGLWTALILIATVSILRSATISAPEQRIAFYFVIALIPLARPEGILWSPFLACLYGIAISLRTGSNRRGMRCAAASLVVSICTILALTTFRLVYFGDPLPNTFYAKVSPDIIYRTWMGLRYFLKFLVSNGMLPIHCVAVGLGLLTFHGILKSSATRASDPNATTRTRLGLVSVVTVVGLIVPVLLGGDHFNLFRFYQPLWPLLFLSTVYALESHRTSFLRTKLEPLSARGRLCVVVIAFSVFSFGNDAKWFAPRQTGRIIHEFGIANSGRQMGLFLNALFSNSSRPSVAVVTSGGIAYTYRGPIVDLMGLNNLAMAHHPGDRKGLKNHAAFSKHVFYMQMPEIVLPRVVRQVPDTNPYSEHWEVRYTMKGLTEDKRFLSRYAVVALSKSSQSQYLLAYVRKDYLASMVKDPAIVVIPVD